MYDAVKEIMPDFDFKRLDEIAVAKAIHRAHATTLDEGEEGLEDFNMPAAPSSAPFVVGQSV